MKNFKRVVWVIIGIFFILSNVTPQGNKTGLKEKAMSSHYSKDASIKWLFYDYSLGWKRIKERQIGGIVTLHYFWYEWPDEFTIDLDLRSQDYRIMKNFSGLRAISRPSILKNFDPEVDEEEPLPVSKEELNISNQSKYIIYRNMMSAREKTMFRIDHYYKDQLKWSCLYNAESFYSKLEIDD